jgi:DNA-binding GntR family transcriptional regulator
LARSTDLGPKRERPIRGEAIARVAEVLRRQILSGDLAPGERVGQAEVAAELGVSRSPVREALRELHAAGLVEVASKRGARVVRLDRRQLDEVYWLRERLEPAALAESVPHLDDEDIAAIRRCVADAEDEWRTAGATPRWHELDRRFHFTCIGAAPLPEVLRLAERLWNQASPYMRSYLRESGPTALETSHVEHRLVLDAIERRDPPDAERLLAVHIRRTRLALAASPSIPTGPGPGREVSQ